ncbi:MAG: hypothetical protein AB199_03210 [Parcubacteria bacterium C7867-004]|nr:MAG: hypothetical protein AB199_03210 [Parcubacteria bacterium C7867-004]
MNIVKQVWIVGLVWLLIGLGAIASFVGFSDPEFAGFLTGKLVVATLLPALIVSYFAGRSKKPWSLLGVIIRTSALVILFFVLMAQGG